MKDIIRHIVNCKSKFGLINWLALLITILLAMLISASTITEFYKITVNYKNENSSIEVILDQEGRE